jgi:hypothetical protein
LVTEDDMGDWSAEDLAKAIERRRGRKKRGSGAAQEQADKSNASFWSERDWVNQFRLLHGGAAHLRGVTQVCVRDSDGEIMWEGGVREFDRPVGERVGYAWLVPVRDEMRFTSAEHGGAIRCAEDAVRARL